MSVVTRSAEPLSGNRPGSEDSVSTLKILVLAPTRVSSLMTGPTIRALELARQLGPRFDTTLAVPRGSDELGGEPFRTRHWERRSVAGLLGGYDVAISQGTQVPARACLRGNGRKPVQVFDLYDPLLFEIQMGDGLADRARRRETVHLSRLTGLLLQRADFVLCASPQQRDLWLGGMYVSGRFRTGEAQERVGIVPFGHDGSTPVASRPALKGVHPGIAREDRVLLWGGGVWNWLDPLTPIRAMARIEAVDPGVKLVFMGTRHPSHAGAQRRMLERARALAAELGLLDRTVFFGEGWVPFAERQDYLLDADLALCTAPEGPENHFSFRARMVDAVWAGVPLICTRGGGMAEFVERNGAGLTVRGGDVAGLQRAILEALRSEAQRRFRASLAGCRDQLSWTRCARPLVEFCERVASGKLARAAEPAWRPLLQYLQYKIPSLVERSFG